MKIATGGWKEDEKYYLKQNLVIDLSVKRAFDYIWFF